MKVKVSNSYINIARILAGSNSSKSINIRFSIYLLKIVYFLSITPGRHVTRGKWVGLEFAVCVSFVLHLIPLQTFFLLVTTPGVILKREVNSKLYQKLTPESQSHQTREDTDVICVGGESVATTGAR